MAYSMSLDIIDCSRNRLFHIHSIEETAVYHLTFLGIKAGLADIRTLNERNDRQRELLCESIVAAVMGGDRHNGTGTISGENILGNPDRDLVACKRIDGVRTRENSGHSLSCNPIPLCLFLYHLEIFGDLFFLLRCCQFLNPLALRSKDHESHSKNSIRTGSKDSHIVLFITTNGLENHLGTLRLANPVTLHLFERIGPVEPVKTFEKPSCVSRNP